MKKLLFLLLILSVVTSYAQIPSYLPTNGLVGYWPFNGNANDESGNGNNGTVISGLLSNDRFGNPNSSYYLNGQTDYITVPSVSSMLPNRITLSAWVKIPSNYTGNNRIGPIIRSRFYGYILWFDLLNGSVQHILHHNSSTATTTNTSNNINDNQWHQIVGSFDGANNKLYFDGQLVSTVPTTVSSLYYVSDGPVAFGRDGNNPSSSTALYQGWIDDIGIYNRALSSQEISNLYSSSAPCIANITNNDTTICRGASVTLNAAAVNSSSVTDINGNVYPTVNIGTQTWMQKNLNVSKYKNGDIIPQVTDGTQWANLTTGAWCWYNNDSATYAATYGKLYNGYAVNDIRGLAPDGYHIPSNSEWDILVKYLDPSADTSCISCFVSYIAGGKLKDTNNWASPNIGANNSSLFSGKAAGVRVDNSAVFNGLGTIALFWGSQYNQSSSWNRDLSYANEYVEKTYSRNVYGLSVRALRNTSTYLWSNGATTPSITVSPTVTTTYYLTVTDGNGNTCTDSVKVIVGATALPSAPTAITGATDICSYFISPTVATSGAVTYTAAVATNTLSYNWTVPTGVTLVSGQGTNSITVTFASTFVSGAITVNSVNACGSSTAARSLTVYKRVAATPGVIQKEFSPTSIVAVTNVTGLVSETYRIKKVLYATSYNWSMNQGTSATITHINPSGVNDTAVIVTFANCFVRDTLSVKSVTPCSISAVRTSILYAYSTPAAVLGITTVGGNFATCIGVNKTFTAVRGTPTTLQAPIAAFRWTTPANTTIVSATSDSSSVTVSFNTGYTGGSISAKGVSSCGTIGTTASTAILQFLPPGVLSIASSTGAYNACIGNSITYSALVSAPSTSQVAASVFRWTKPNNTTIISAAADSSTITLQFNTGYIGGTLSVKGQTSCGTQGTAKSQALTHAGCAAGTKMSLPVTTTANSFEVSLYPNPSAGEFKLLVNLVGGKTPTSEATKAIVKVIDIQGRLMKSFECNANQVTALGNELKPGVYMVEVRMGNEVKTVRAVRF